MFVCMLIEWYVLAEILAFETYPVSEPYWKNLWHEDKNTHARAREREGETRYVAGTHCPRNQLNGMARSPSMDPQIWSASSKSLPFLASTQSNTVRGGNFPVRFGTIDSLNYVLCFFVLLFLLLTVVVSCVQADAFLLAIAGGPDLLARIQTRYFEKSKSHVARVGLTDKCSATNCNNVFNKERSGTPQTSSVPRSSPFFHWCPNSTLPRLRNRDLQQHLLR